MADGSATGSAGFASWRGTLGLIKPTYRPGGLEEFIRLLPDGVSVIPLFVGFRKGTHSEFSEALPAIEDKIRELSELGVDLIDLQGAPPLMIRGLDGERQLLAKWEREYGVQVVTSGTSQVQAMQALGMRRIVGVTYFPDELNKFFARYFIDAGIDVLRMEGIDIPFAQAGRLSSHEVYAFVRSVFLKDPGVDGIYMLGAGWRVLDIIEMLEQDFEVPVVQSTPASIWAVERHLHIRQPVQGYGRLLAQMPPLPPSNQ